MKIFDSILPCTSERLHGLFGYETPLFSEQYIEKISDALGTHKGLKHCGVEALQ